MRADVRSIDANLYIWQDELLVSKHRASLETLQIRVKVMAFGWITVLKIIPWKDVLENAPHIAKAAKNLYAGTRNNTSSSGTADSSAPTSDSGNKESTDFRLQEIEREILDLNSVVRSLAKQNVRIVEAIEVLRIRSKILIFACIALGSISICLILLLIFK